MRPSARRSYEIGPRTRFAATFGALSLTLLGLYYFPYAEGGAAKAWIDGFLHLYAGSAAFVLHFFDPTVYVAGNDILGRHPLRIVRTCDAMDVEILLASAIAAWPLPWRRRLATALAGIALVYVVNVVRICSLYFIGVRFPDLFETAHLDVWPALMLLVAVGFFLAATTWRRGKDTEAGIEPG